MKALVKHTAEPGLRLMDVPEPEYGPDDVLIKVLRTGICGTDLHIRSWDGWAQSAVKTPLVLGHEFVGEVAAVGSAVTETAVGDLVSGEGHLVCGKCRNCLAGRRHLCRATVGLGVGRDGAFAEYVVLPASNVWVHRTKVDLDVAAIFDPFGNAVHTALSFPLVGEDVLITGAGPIGVMAAAVARHAGARNVVITDVSEPRLELARKVGATLAVNVAESSIAEAQRTLGLKEGFDIGLEMSGRAEAVRDMIGNMTHGGRIAMLGLPAQEFPVDWAKVVTSMITIKGIYGREMFETWYAMTVLLEGGLDLSPVITGKYAYQDFDAAFDEAATARSGKIILDWTA
ncbi:L-threonine 3-dehydrogenase [Streptomyces sp. NPDC001941]|uniref:L-threonine 3-dehydrogenase n=1 Tax=Streptomyces sp. NPDC001941 TaxID=3154659 RepID=UPI003326EF39